MAESQTVPTVLLVEDEPSIRTLMLRMLMGIGYPTLEARNGEEAVSIAEQHQAPIHLLLTDVVMPAMDGFELASRIVRLHSETKVLFLTGYSDDSTPVKDGLNTTSHAVLLKPFTQAALQAKIQEVLDVSPSIV
ncbi:MAG: response regulator [Vicinamibacterales bacterium]|nr:response regulator [Vicinamibacterales bacterium]